MEQTAFQLNEYRIIEGPKGFLRWETHFGLGQQRSGRCVIHGDILIIGRFMYEGNGFLKREFLEGLKSLPPWKRTTYSCMASDLFEVSSGRSLDLSRSGYVPRIAGEKRCHEQTLRDGEQGTFRVDKYAITVTDDMQISWQAWEGFDSVACGRCVIKSGILFIGPKEYAKGERDKRKFLTSLREMAPWKRTRTWGHSLALRSCETQPTRRPFNAMAIRESEQNHRNPGSSVSAFWNSNWMKSLRLTAGKFKMPCFRIRRAAGLKMLKPFVSQRGLEKVGLILLIPSMIVGALGLILGWHSLEEKLHHHHLLEKRHH